MNRITQRWSRPLVLLVFLALFAVGCTESIYHGLDERQANEMVVVLEQHGMEAGKEVDPAGEGTWKVTVPTAVKAQAWQVLQNEGLPRPEVAGFDAFYPSGGLVPTASEERVLLQYATAQELRESLLAIDGIVDARVNLVMPEKPRVQLETTVIEPPRASVLLKYHAGAEEPPISDDATRQLVAGGVEGLEEQQVDIIFTRAARSAKPLAESKLATVGPVSLAPKSKGVFQLLIALMGLCIVLLSAGLVYMVFRARKKSSAGEVMP